MIKTVIFLTAGAMMSASFFCLFFPVVAQSAVFTQSDDSQFDTQRLKEKREALPFSLKSLGGKQVSLGDFKGKPVMLFFWACWCGSCTDELPVIEKFSAGKKDQLAILTIAIDGEKESRIERFVKKKNITLPVLLDVKEKVARSYGVTMVPATFFIDREGFIIGMIRGERDWSSKEAWPAIKDFFSLR